MADDRRKEIETFCSEWEELIKAQPDANIKAARYVEDVRHLLGPKKDAAKEAQTKPTVELSGPVTAPSSPTAKRRDDR